MRFWKKHMHALEGVSTLRGGAAGGNICGRGAIMLGEEQPLEQHGDACGRAGAARSSSWLCFGKCSSNISSRGCWWSSGRRRGSRSQI